MKTQYTTQELKDCREVYHVDEHGIEHCNYNLPDGWSIGGIAGVIGEGKWTAIKGNHEMYVTVVRGETSTVSKYTIRKHRTAFGMRWSVDENDKNGKFLNQVAFYFETKAQAMDRLVGILAEDEVARSSVAAQS